jgi:hypothetical protein
MFPIIGPSPAHLILSEEFPDKHFIASGSFFKAISKSLLYGIFSGVDNFSIEML